MTALLGLDLNGFWDWAAIHEEESTEDSFKDLGVNAAGVRLASNEEEMVVGPQTALAPHGRGQGWAGLGHERLRLSHADLLRTITAPSGDGDLEAACLLLETLFQTLAERARSLVLPVPDDDSVDEAARERILLALRRGRSPSPTLLWRPVAAALGWLHSEGPPPVSPAGLHVAVVSILREGVHFGDLSLVSEQGRRNSLIVPERRRAGAVIWPDFGGANLARWVADSLARQCGLDTREILVGSRTPWTLAAGQDAPPELFRTANRSWTDLDPPQPPVQLAPKRPPPASIIERLCAADVILLEGPGAQTPALRLGVLTALGVSPDDLRLQTLDPRAAARGALEANRRLRRGDPAYFDFLPQLQINALVQGEARFVSLIPAETRLLGGQVYRADAPGDFAIGKGAHELTFYLLKEDFEQARKSVAALPETADRQHEISVSVEQSPGQGFARVRIGSSSFAPLATRPIDLDWTRMEAVEETPEQILAALQSNRGGAYPNTQIYPGHAILWHPESPNGDARITLQRYTEIDVVAAGSLKEEGVKALREVKDLAAKAINPSFAGARLGIAIEQTASTRFLNTDGGLPDAKPHLDIPDNADDLLEAALHKAASDYRRLQPIAGSEEAVRWVVGFATWCYWRCPDTIVEDLLRWYEAGGAGKGGDLIVRLEGLGRVIHREPEARRFYRAIDRRLIAGQPIRNSELAALTRLLGGVDAAADWLSAEQADRFLQATQDLIVEQNDTGKTDAYKRKFKYALLMLAVLLRRRRTSPDFLDPDNRAARTLERLLVVSQNRMEKWVPDFRRQAGRARGEARQRANAAGTRLEKTRDIVAELIFFLHKEGRDPNIIQRIDAMED